MSATTSDHRSGDHLVRGRAWLPALVPLVNIGALGILVAYSVLNLRPEVASVQGLGSQVQRESMIIAFVLAVLAPTAAGIAVLRPTLSWLRRNPDLAAEVPSAVGLRAAHLPAALSIVSLLGWALVTVLVMMRYVPIAGQIPASVGIHVVARPILTGLISASATFFAADYACRKYLWPRLLAGMRIGGNPRLRRVRVWHRLLALWLAISFVPLAAVLLTTLAPVTGLNLAADPALKRVVSVILLIATSAALGGALLAWLVSRSLARPLAALESAIAHLRDGRLDTRQTIDATDETGTLAEGFNLMAERLSQSYQDLERRNRELAAALERVVFLEQVKRGLDRFVPEAVRRAIEENPEAPGLRKAPVDVTVMFLDIEGYTRLTETLPRPALNAIVERYFSLYLEPIRAHGGDINETAGDGLMILFREGEPEQHAAAAARAALAIRERTQAANRSAAGAHPAITVNIGIASGECDVGAVRFEGHAGERWTFTASGAATNLAARLGDRAVGGQILLGPETVERVRGGFDLKRLGPVQLKNYAVPVEAWEILGEKPTNSRGTPTFATSSDPDP